MLFENVFGWHGINPNNEHVIETLSLQVDLDAEMEDESTTFTDGNGVTIKSEIGREVCTVEEFELKPLDKVYGFYETNRTYKGYGWWAVVRGEEIFALDTMNEGQVYLCEKA